MPDVALEICRLAAARFPESGVSQLALVRALCDMNRAGVVSLYENITGDLASLRKTNCWR